MRLASANIVTRFQINVFNSTLYSIQLLLELAGDSGIVSSLRILTGISSVSILSSGVDAVEAGVNGITFSSGGRPQPSGIYPSLAIGMGSIATAGEGSMISTRLAGKRPVLVPIRPNLHMVSQIMNLSM
jgi:hypothetical protein